MTLINRRVHQAQGKASLPRHLQIADLALRIAVVVIPMIAGAVIILGRL